MQLLGRFSHFFRVRVIDFWIEMMFAAENNYIYAQKEVDRRCHKMFKDPDSRACIHYESDDSR